MIFNSALLYETALLKPLCGTAALRRAQGLRGSTSRPSGCWEFLSYFLPVPADDVPRTSLLREFIGGGCYPG